MFGGRENEMLMNFWKMGFGVIWLDGWMQGFVNDQFWELQLMKNRNQPDYVVRVVTSYCLSAQTLFSQLTHYM